MKTLALCLGLFVSTAAQANPLAALFEQMKASYGKTQYAKVIQIYEGAGLKGARGGKSAFMVPMWWLYAIALHEDGRYCAALTEYDAMRAAKVAGKLLKKVDYRKIRLAPKLTGRLQITCADLNPLTVSVGPKTIRECGAIIDDLQPGRHSVNATLNGAAFQAAAVEVPACQTAVLALPRPGTVRWQGAPMGVDVSLGTHRLGPASVAHALPPGRHALTLQVPGQTAQPHDVTIKAGRDQTLAFVTGIEPTSRALPWAALTTSALLAGAGGYFLIRHLDDTDTQASAQAAYLAERQDLQQAGVLRARLVDAEDTANKSATLAIIFGGIGAAGLIGSTLWLMSTGDDSTPHVTTNGRTISVGGRW